MTKYNELVANAGSPGVNMSGTLVGADRVLFYIRESPVGGCFAAPC